MYRPWRCIQMLMGIGHASPFLSYPCLSARMNKEPCGRGRLHIASPVGAIAISRRFHSLHSTKMAIGTYVMCEMGRRSQSSEILQIRGESL